MGKEYFRAKAVSGWRLADRKRPHTAKPNLSPPLTYPYRLSPILHPTLPAVISSNRQPLTANRFHP